jgi:hypothetical protein
MPTAGYSLAPLARKLGIVTGCVVVTRGAPPGYAGWLAPLPDGVRLTSRVTASTDIVHVFTTDRSTLARWLKALRARIRPDAALWVSWPKQASGVPTSITDDVIRQLCLPLGLVDVKVCAVDETWSGLKLVLRKELRPKRR